jgi:cytochrome c oxidase subunit II
VVNQFTIRATTTGTYFGQCTQLCGLYHSLMYFRVKVVKPPQYAQWIASFNNPTDAAKAAAATKTTNEELASGVASKNTSTRFGR